ncbi:MAG TPA: LysM domain-containing protein [Drouetiella sp.]
MVETKEKPCIKDRSSEGGQERQELPHVDRVALLKNGGAEPRGQGTESATKYLPALSIDHGTDGRGAAPGLNGLDSRGAASGQNYSRPTDGSQSAGHTHEVQQGESLWRIARRSLRESGAPSGNQDIEKAIKQIVELNKGEHPSLESNPNLIQAGWNLKMPPGMGAGNMQNSRPDLYRFDGGHSNNRFGVQQQFGFPWQQYGQERQQSGQYGAGGQYGGDPLTDFQNLGSAVFGGISDLATSLRDAAMRTASGMGGQGRCAAGVQVALARMGQGQWMGSGNAWDMGAKMARSGNFDMLPLSHAREGDIVVRSWNRNVIAQHGGRNHGDIVVVTGADRRGNLMGANDHHGRIAPDGGRYQNSYVLRFRDNSYA